MWMIYCKLGLVDETTKLYIELLSFLSLKYIMLCRGPTLDK